MSKNLLQACRDGNTEKVAQLLSTLGDLGDYESKVLICAIEMNRPDILDLLLNHCGDITDQYDNLIEIAEEWGFLHIRDNILAHHIANVWKAETSKKNGKNSKGDDSACTISVRGCGSQADGNPGRDKFRKT